MLLPYVCFAGLAEQAECATCKIRKRGSGRGEKKRQNHTWVELINLFSCDFQIGVKSGKKKTGEC